MGAIATEKTNLDVNEYLTDGKRLVQVIASHQHGVMVEDCATEQEFVIRRSELPGWRRVKPPKEKKRA